MLHILQELEEKEKEPKKCKLDTTQCFKNEDTKHVKEIDKKSLVSKIRSIKPQMTFMVICYSEINDLNFLLEGYGIFAEMRMNRDLNILSNGQILTMNDVQKEFIQTIGHEDHVEKDFILRGPVGSGKTILGLEAIKIKKSHYKYGISSSDFKNQLRVIVLIGWSTDENQLKQQLEMSENNSDCTLEIQTESLSPHVKSLTKIFQANESYKSYLYTIIMMDEIER